MLAWIKAWLQDHFGFSKAETNGTLVLLLLCCLCLIAPQGLRWYYSMQPEVRYDEDIALLERTVALLEAQKQTLKPNFKGKSRRNFHHSQQLQLFDINTADEAQLSAIKGIGPVLSARIVKFRNKLGGFVRQAQYEEVYGLGPAVINRLKKYAYISPSFCPKLLNINTVDVQTLAAHPYLTYQQAKGIVRYRKQHGRFPHVASLEVLVLMDKATLGKVKAYLTVH